MTTIDTAARSDRAFLGHPRGLGFLAFTEAWERFSYYGMQTLLLLYMVKYLLLPGHIEHVAFFREFHSLPMLRNLSGEALGTGVFGLYTALVPFTPLFGGIIADRWLGRTRSVIIGAVMMAAGHFMMAFEQSFLFALLAIILGGGLFKGNLASQVGGLYAPNDLRRADAFQIYYLAINAGVIISPIITGTLGEKVGWHWGFGAAGVGMMISIIIYLSGRKWLPRDETKAALKGSAVVAPKMTPADWGAFGLVLLLIPVLAVAVMPNQEIFAAYLLWGDKSFNLNLFGFTLPTSWLITIDSIMSVAFLAIVALFWRWWAQRRQEPDELGKMVIGAGFSILGMLCLWMAAVSQPPGGKISMVWPMGFELFNSIAFAHILPIALALFARLAPKPLAATTVGAYSMAIAIGNYAVGWIAGKFDTIGAAGFWLIHAALAGGAGAVFLVVKLALDRRAAPVPATA